MTLELDQLTFEAAFAELETILRRLDQEEMTLDESVALFERGRALAAHCQRLLDQAELRVTSVNNAEA